MDQKTIQLKGLLLTGSEMYTIPGLAIIGAMGIVSSAGYGVYKLITKVVKTRKEKTDLVKSIEEFKEYVSTLKEKGELN